MPHEKAQRDCLRGLPVDPLGLVPLASWPPRIRAARTRGRRARRSTRSRPAGRGRRRRSGRPASAARRLAACSPSGSSRPQRRERRSADAEFAAQAAANPVWTGLPPADSRRRHAGGRDAAGGQGCATAPPFRARARAGQRRRLRVSPDRTGAAVTGAARRARSSVMASSPSTPVRVRSWSDRPRTPARPRSCCGGMLFASRPPRQCRRPVWQRMGDRCGSEQGLSRSAHG